MHSLVDFSVSFKIVKFFEDIELSYIVHNVISSVWNIISFVEDW
jgi:hypothetical protein